MKYLHAILLPFIICMYFQPAFGAEKLALLIGINDYSLSCGFSNLKGPQNDIKIMKTVLEEKRFGFNEIIVLMNEQATHSRIEEAFKRLIDHVREEKVNSVYIYFSGHGSLTRDLNGDEEQIIDIQGHILSRYDQTWVTYASRLRKDAPVPQGLMEIDDYDVLDDEIAQWLDEIASHCDQVVFVSDSCHSGSVSRSGVAGGVRKGPADKRDHPKGRREYRAANHHNIVRVGASNDAQVAREFIPQGETEEYGVFSWYWTKALATCSSNDSWSHIFNRVSSIVEQETPNRQAPQISGAVTMKLFGSDFLAPAQGIPIYQVLDKGDEKHVSLAAGHLSGVTKDSVYTLEGKAGQADAPKLMITRVNPTQSIAVTRANVQVYDQVVEISHHYKFLPTRLLLKAEHENDCAALEDIGKIVNGLDSYKITADEQACDLIIYLFRPKSSSLPSIDLATESTDQREPPKSSEKSQPEIWILDNNGFLYLDNLRHSYTKEGLAALSRNLIKLARVKDMMQVASPAKSSPLQISVTPMIPEAKDGDRCPECMANKWPSTVCAAKQYRVLEPLPLADFLSKKWDLCTIMQFNAKNPTARTYYFYVVYIGNDAEIVPVFPSIEDNAQLAEIRPGSETVRGKALIRLDTKTLDRYKLIACKEPINHHLFSQTGAELAMRGSQTVGKLNPLERILLNAATGTRDGGSYDADSWYAETITIDMR